jgi:hypothetical protein
MRGAYLFLVTWFVLGGLIGVFSEDSCLPLFCAMVVLAFLGKVVDLLEGRR